METRSPPNNETICPTCGEPMRRMPTLDGSDYVDLCLRCHSGPDPITVEEDILDPSSPEEPIQDTDPRTRFRELILSSQKAASPDDWADELLETLPEEARAVFSGKGPASGSTENEKFSETLADALRDRGYVIDQDAHGVRISGGPSGGLDSETFSPYDVIRMAADLEGGVLPLGERIHCLKCDAVIPPGEARCQWCGEPAPPREETPDQE